MKRFIGVILVVLGGCAGEPISTVNGADTNIADVAENADVTGDVSAADTSANPCDGQPEGTACDDGDPCTLEDSCAAGTCVGGTNETCETDEPCMAGTCVAGEGCKFEALADGTLCSMACFNAASCMEGACVVDPDSQVECPAVGDESGCVEEVQCDPDTGECTLEIPKPEGTVCDTDTDLCTTETCDAAGGCVKSGATNTCEEEKASDVCQNWLCDKKDGVCKGSGFVGEISCNDGNECTFNDKCTQDEFNFTTCAGTPIPFDDNNPCTDDSCVEGEILHKAINGLACDPEDPCSAEGTCSEAVCEPKTVCECTLDADCPQPESKCLGVAFCDTNGAKPICAINPETIVVCEAIDSDCEVNACVPATGKCVAQPIDDGTVCNDGNPCTLADNCVNGFCSAGANLDCDDGVYCNGNETCDKEAGCQPGTSVETDDGVACTQDACDEASQSVKHTPNDAACDNGLYCDGQETCHPNNGCKEGIAPLVDDGVPCTNDACDEAQDEVVHTPNHADCDDGLACNGQELCDAAKGCQNNPPVAIDDGVACTVDSCDADTGLAIHEPDDSLCDNGLYCDGAESCDALKGCQSGDAPDLSDGVECTADVCDEELDAIKHTPKDAFCDNGQYCDGVESCDAAEGCQAGEAPKLDDGVVCTIDGCDEALDAITHTVDHAFCNNGQYCDGVESCDAAEDCVAGDAPSIDDGVACTADACDEESDVVTHTPTHADCDDGLACNGQELCDAANGCQNNPPVVIDDGVDCTVDSCDADTGLAVHEADDSLCDNGLYCDGAEVCDAKLDCQSGDAPDLSDGVECTVDVCDEELDAIKHTPKDAFCDNGQYCDGVETCDVDNGCQAGQAPDLSDGVECTIDGCDEAVDAITHTVDHAFCNNGQYCDGSETCDVDNGCQAGQAPDLSDGVSCTVDSCDEAGDASVHTPDDSACDDANLCTDNLCDAKDDCTYPALPNDTSCSVDDAFWCQDGQCVVMAVCGNGNIEAPEVCDDGENNESADGACLADCSGLQICGDGEVAGSEDCDGPNCCGCTIDEVNPNQCVLGNTVGGEFEGAKLIAVDGAEGDYFGWSVSISGDTLVVGARYDDDKGSNSGSAYVYVRSGGVWTEQQKLIADDGAASDYFGYSVSISGDTLVVGARDDDDKGSGSGSAYVYVRNGGVWTEQQKLTAVDGAAGDTFGYSVSISGDTLVVGALDDDDKGVSSGSAYVYVRSGGVWTEQQKLTAVDGAEQDYFGYSVAISGDTLVVGAHRDDDKGGASGSAYVYVRNGGVWTEQQKLIPDDGGSTDYFGISVSISGDTLVVGAYYDDDKGTNSGSAYVYVRSGGVWSEQQKLIADDGAADDEFGYSVSISGDTLVVGAHRDDDKGGASGSAYVYVRNGGVWTEQQKLTTDDGAASDWFGTSVSISGDSLVVGAYGDDDKGSDSGSAYVFESNPNCPTPDTCECLAGYVGPTCAETECGDGVVAGDEECDDGNDLDGDGCDEACALHYYLSCKAWLAGTPNLADGIYTVDPDGPGGDEPFDVYCDMTTQGGGWTYVARGSNDNTQNDEAYGGVQTDPTVAQQWHFSMKRMAALVESKTPYSTYVVMGENGDSDAKELGQYRLRRDFAPMTFSSAMYDYDAWNGSKWVSSSGQLQPTARGPAWMTDNSNLCCESNADGALNNCYEANGTAPLWSQGNANQHIRCLSDVSVQNGLLLFVRAID